MIKRSFYGALPFVFLVACGESEISSTVQHDVSAPTRSFHKAQWVETTHEEHVVATSFLKHKGFRGYLNQDHEAVKRLQQWADLFDGVIRQADPQGTQHAPKPVVEVALTTEPNAFMMPSVVCYSTPVLLEGVQGKSEEDLTLFYNGKFYLDDASSCEKMVSDPQETYKMVDYFVRNRSKNDKCRIDIANKTIRIGASCELDPSFKAMGIGKTSMFAMMAASQRITIFSGMTSLLNNETQLAGILAHELGHYYRSHGTNFKGDYDYFYAMPQYNFSQKPAAIPQYEGLGKKMQYYGQMSPSLEEVKIEGTSFHRDLTPVWLSTGMLGSRYVKDHICLENEECNKSYKEFANHAMLSGVLWEFVGSFSILKNYPFKKVESSFHENFVKAEQLFKAFAQKAPVKTSSTEYQDFWKRSLEQLTNFPSKLVSDESEKAENVLELLNFYSQSMNDAYVARDALLHKANSWKLGWYSFENEADDIATELLAKTGLSPLESSKVWLSFSQYQEGYLKNNGILIDSDALSYRECQKAFDQNWKDAQGRPLYIPLGSWGDNHHSDCFRAWNIYQETKAHHYPSLLPMLKPMSQEGWEQWVQMLKDTYENAPELSQEEGSSLENINKRYFEKTNPLLVKQMLWR